MFNIVSPHLDDAILSCSRFIGANADSTIITVFANGPKSVNPLTSWDKQSLIFNDGDDVMLERRAEDVIAAKAINAIPFHMSYWDRHYRMNPQYEYAGLHDDSLIEPIAKSLVELSDDSTFVFPLGFGHVDHSIVSRVGLLLADKGFSILFYADLPYAEENTNEIRTRLRRLKKLGVNLIQADVKLLKDYAVKQKAIDCYVSQKESIGIERLNKAVFGQELFWRINNP